MRSNLISLAVLITCFAQQLSAQKANPFELLWRKDTIGLTANVKPVVMPDSAPIASIPPEITPEITPQIADTIAELIDTPLRHVEMVEIDTIALNDTVISGEQAAAFEDVGTSSVATLPVISNPQTTSENSSLALVLLFGLVFTLLAWGLSLNRELLEENLPGSNE